MQAVKEVYEMQLKTKECERAHAEEMHKQAVAHKDQVHAMELASAHQKGEHKVLEAKLEASDKMTAMYQDSLMPLFKNLASSKNVSTYLQS